MERYRQNPVIIKREMGEDIFLVNPEHDETYHLNVTGAALWRLLSDPVSFEAVTDIFQNAFPDGSQEHINADVTALFVDFVEHKLIIKTN